MPATAIQANAAAVTAVVDSLTTNGASPFRITVTLRTAAEVQSMPNLAAPGQSMTLEPRFSLTPEGVVDSTNAVNRRLFGVQKYHPGDLLEGTITLDREGHWRLLDVAPSH